MKHYAKNLSLLAQKNLDLANRIEHCAFPEGLFVVESKSGTATLGKVDASGSTAFLSSPLDPVMEAKDLLRERSFKKTNGTVLYGFGLGYLCKEVIRKKEQGHVCYVVEGSPEVFKLAMAHVDLSDIFGDEHTHFFVGESARKIPDHFESMQLRVIGGRINKLGIPLLYELFGSFYDEIDALITKHVSSVRTSVTTFHAVKEKCLANFFGNVISFSQSLPVENLKDTAQGKAALVVGAGPTLDHDLETIRREKDCFLIISVDAALKPLLAHSIIPDVVVTCDTLPVNAKKIEDIPQKTLSQITLAYQADATPALVNAFRGTKYLVNSENTLATWLVNTGRPILRFPNVQTVSHLGFFLARYMGADPIVLVGVDLSFPDGRDHAKQCVRTWGIDIEKEEFEWTMSNNGNPVRTNQGFLSMIHIFEQEIQKTHSQKCINVSRDGALIRNAERIPLAHVVEGIKTGNRKCLGSNSFQRIPPISRDESKRLLDLYKQTIGEMVLKAEELLKICTMAQGLLNGTCLDQKNRKKELSDLFHRAFLQAELLDILTDYLPEYMIYSWKHPMKAQCRGDGAHGEIDVERTAIFFNNMMDVLPLLEKHGRNVLVRLKEIH